jgi:hypothetical protein
MSFKYRFGLLFEQLFNYKSYLVILTIIMVLMPSLDTVCRYYHEREIFDNGAESEEDRIELISGVNVTQIINIEGVIKSISIVIDAMKRQNHGSFSIDIWQDDNIMSETIFQMDKLALYKRIDIENKRADTFLLPVEIHNIKAGALQLRIRGIDGEIGKSVGLVMSRGLYFGACQTGEYLSPHEMNLRLVMEAETIPQLSIIRLCLFILLLILTVFAAKGIFRERISDRQMQLTAFTIIFVSICLHFPQYSFFAEPVFETGLEYFPQASLFGLQSLLLPDYTYLAFLPRLINFLVIDIFQQSRWAFVFTYMISIGIVSFICSFFSSSFFSSYMKKEFRFMCCLLLGITDIVLYKDGSSVVILNIAYLGLFFIFFSSLIINNISKSGYIGISLAGFIFCISKGLYIVLLPVSVIMITINILKRQWKLLPYFLSITIGTLIQLRFTMLYNSAWKFAPDISLFTIISSFPSTFLNFTNDFTKALFSSNFPSALYSGYILHSFSIIIISILIVISLKQIISKSITTRESIVIIASLLIGFGSIYFAVLAHPANYLETTLSNLPAQWHIHSHIFTYICFTIIAVMFFSYILHINNGHLIFCIIFTLFAIPRLPSIDKNIYGMTASNWSQYYKLTEKKSYAVPQWDGTRFMFRDAKIFYIGSGSDKFDDNRWQIFAKPILISHVEDADNAGYFIDISAHREDFLHKRIIALYCSKLYVMQNGKIRAIVKNIFGDTIADIQAVTNNDSKYLGFLLEMPAEEIAVIEFVDDSGAHIDLEYDFYVAVTM